MPAARYKTVLTMWYVDSCNVGGLGLLYLELFRVMGALRLTLLTEPLTRSEVSDMVDMYDVDESINV